MSIPRLRKCVEAWPECSEGEYDPSCCRFPKSCSCTVYDSERVSESDLEPKMSILGMSDEEKEKERQRDERIKQLAQKLGIEPLSENTTSLIIFVLADGTRYSWEELVLAHVNLMIKE